jgi:plastocyanin
MKYISYFFTAIASSFLVILLSLSACSPTPKAIPSQTAQPQASPQTADFTVEIRNFKFEPANLAIAVGKTVRFINLDEEPHTVTATEDAFDSKALDTDQTWNYTPLKPGVYPYICSIHPFMKGTLTVTPKKN